MKESVMTVQDLAQYLKVKPITVYKHLSSGRLPGFKVGASWRFRKATIDRWIDEQEKQALVEEETR